MGWKDINKSNFNISVPHYTGEGKGEVWPFTLSSADDRYDEGDIITDSENPVWRTPPFTGEATQNAHDPCGYWYCGSQAVYTTLLYPVLVTDKIDGVPALLEGIFEDVVYDYTIPTESIDGAPGLLEGEFKTLIPSFSIPAESLEGSPGLVSGLFKDVMLQYEGWPIEDLEASPNITSGLLKNVNIYYTNWPTESLDCDGVDLTAGEFNDES